MKYNINFMILYLFLLILQLINAINNDKKNNINNLLINNKSSTSINHSTGELKYTDIPDDCSYIKSMISNSDDISLICSLRTINSEFDTTNFSVIPSDHTIDLKVVCNDDLMIKSNLESKSFAHLTKLRALTIKFCKISQFHSEILFGLKELRNLTIQTDNIIWIDFILNLEQGSFDSTKNLERLDLSQNNIWTLPIGIFCPLNRLIFLNISENRLQDINELGFRDRSKSDEIQANSTLRPPSLSNVTCSLDLEILDMSYNNFVLLPINGFGILKRLKILKLNNNEISMIADKALNGLKNLKILNLNANKIVALPSELFSDCLNSIQDIYLQNNSITVLSSKLFSNLEQLQALDLSFNQITSNWIDKNTFIGLIRLVLLNLSHNKITKLESDYFLDLYTLQILNLKHNQLDNIEANTFSLMNNLHTLLLSYNNLKHLSGHALNGLYVLSLLSLDNNRLSDINSDAFRNCSSLQDINLNGNELNQIPLALRNMRLLHTIDLGENLISSIDNDTFKDLHNLYGLRLIGNNLTKINSNAFKDLPNLQILNLAHNKINEIDKNSFNIIPKIQAIRLDGNLLKNIDNLFDKISSLLWLNISDNKLQEFDFKSIPNSLQWLDIHKNEIKYLSNSLKLQLLNNTELKLQTLDASFNQITRITPNSIPNSMELLFLNDNQVTSIEPNSFKLKINLTRVDLYANQIKSLDEKSFRIEPVPVDRPLPEFYIGGNPFICNCNIEYLQKINQLTTRQYPKIMDLDTIYCKLLNSREIAYIPLVNAKSKHFLCSYASHCFALCHCCEFDACDCEMTCPNNCTCFHDQSWSTNIVDCSGAYYNEIPSNIPMDTTEVYLDGNNLIELSGHSFIGRKNLLVLYANNSNIQFIYNTTFSGLKRLTILNLSHNKLIRLYGNEFNNLENLKELYINDNKISYITNGTFNNLHKLEILRLDGNKLVQFEIYNQLQMNKNLIAIGLAGNLWSCECSYLSKLRNYLQMNAEKILDANRVACIYNNMSSVLKEKNGTKCTLREGISTYVHGSEIENLLPLLLVGTCAFIGFFGLILGLFCYRREIFILIQSNSIFKWCFKSNPDYIEANNKDRFYDAYICNSLQDEHFINHILADTLENIGYRLSLHYRDLNLNLYITDAILETVECSKQAVLVLSKNFLYNEWTRFEYKSALHELINRRKKLVIILYGDLPTRDIDSDMRHYLKTNTCIEWDDKKFWQKLRIALPQPNKGPCMKTRSAFNIYGGSHHNYPMERNNLAGKSYDCRSLARINNYSKTYDSNFEKLALPSAGFLPDGSSNSSNHHFNAKCSDDYIMTRCKTLPNDDKQRSKIKDNNTLHNTTSQAINNKNNCNNQTSICNISVNGSISSGNSTLSRTNNACNNDCNDCNDYSECKISNDDDNIKENKMSSYMWS